MNNNLARKNKIIQSAGVNKAKRIPIKGWMWF
jgi:hypothetical protein